jgi:hypothetical protein
MQTSAQGFIGCLKVTIRQPNIGVLFVEGLLTTLLAFPFASSSWTKAKSAICKGMGETVDMSFGGNSP